jgi:hypothetical protein
MMIAAPRLSILNGSPANRNGNLRHASTRARKSFQRGEGVNKFGSSWAITR